MTLANHYRDRLKHVSDGETVSFSVDGEAAMLIERAVVNYKRLVGTLSKEMQEFRALGFFPPREDD